MGCQLRSTTSNTISPFSGRKDPELLGEDDLRDIVEQADFYGPLVDARDKGNTIEYLGRQTVDGDEVYRLKATLKNGELHVTLPKIVERRSRTITIPVTAGPPVA